MSRKRRRTEDGEDDFQVDTDSREAPGKKRSKAPKHIDTAEIDEGASVNHAISRMDPSLLADYAGRSTRRFAADLTSIELEDLYLPGNTTSPALTTSPVLSESSRVVWKVADCPIARLVRDSSGWSGRRDLDGLLPFLEHSAGTELRASAAAKGSPHTLLITGAAMRAVHLTRQVRQYQSSEVKVAKLFAKHIKLNEAVQSLNRLRVNIAVGTPQRILDVLDAGALKVGSLERIVVDASHVDQKKRGILDMRETVVPLMKLLRRLRLAGAGLGEGSVLFF